MATKSDDFSSGFTFNYEMRLDLNELGLPSSIYVTEPEEQDAANSAIRAALEATGERNSKPSRQSPRKPFSEGIAEYFSKSQTKPQTKAPYRSKLDHAQTFFGDSKCLLTIDQADFVGYCDHVLATVPNITSQGHYMTTVATFLNWYRVRAAGLPALTTRTLVPKRDSPESDDRDAFTLEQLGSVFENASSIGGATRISFGFQLRPHS